MKFTYYTIIGKDLNLLKGHVKNIKEYAGFDRLTCEKEFTIIIYENEKIPKAVTEELHGYCKQEGLKIVPYIEQHPDFISNLYACWNLGYESADEGYVFRGGSDQVFSKDSFVNLFDITEKTKNLLGDKIILQANTIENIRRSPGSRHFITDFGDTFENFKFEEFEIFCNEINKNVKEKILDIDTALSHWNHPTPIDCSLGRINRTDGCSWLMEKKDWTAYGPIPVIINNVTGDVLIHDYLQQHGYKNFIVRDCITYHFVRGESLAIYG